MDSRSVDEIGTQELLRGLQEVNRRRTQGEWSVFEDRYLIAEGRLTPTVAQTGTIKAKENAAFLGFLAGNVQTIIERLERLARLEKLIEELESSSTTSDSSSAMQSESLSEQAPGATVSSAEATYIQSDSPLVAGLA